MLGVEPVSGSTVSDYPTNYNLTLTLTGKLLNAFKGILGDTEQVDLASFRLAASQAPFNYFAATYYIAAQPALHVQHAPALDYYQGFPPPSQISLQARQGAIQFQKLYYNLLVGGATIEIHWEDVNTYHSKFGPPELRGTIFVYEDPQAHMRVPEEI